MRIQQTVRQIIFILILILVASGLRFLVVKLFAEPTLAEKNAPIFEEKNYQSTNIYIYNLTDEEEIYSKNAQEQRAPASLTKLMTSTVALENISDYSQSAPVLNDIYQEMVRENASMAGFDPGEKTTYNDLLYGILLPSGGECAGSMAVHVGGTTGDFVRRMNEEAEKLGLVNSFFNNPVGLDREGHYTCAQDIAMIFKRALSFDKFRRVISTSSIRSSKTSSHPGGLLLESNLLKELPKYSQEGFKIIGGKSGTTYNAGLCLVTLAEKNGKEIITVVMGYPFENISDPGDGDIVETLDILKSLEI